MDLITAAIPLNSKKAIQIGTEPQSGHDKNEENQQTMTKI